MGTNHAVEECLDRALATTEWLQFYPRARLKNLMAPMSDHSLILLECDVKLAWTGKRRFHFDHVWLQESDIDDVVTSGWQRITQGHLINKLEGCTDALMSWSRKLRFHFKEDIKVCKSRLAELRDQANDDAYREMETLNHKWCSLLVQEELFWQQRAKKFWLCDGDSNSQFFHASTTMRQKRNQVHWEKHLPYPIGAARWNAMGYWRQIMHQCLDR